MSDFNKDDYLNDLPDADELANGLASGLAPRPSCGAGSPRLTV